MSQNLRTFTIKVANYRVPVTLGYQYTGWVLALAKPVNDNSSNPLEHGAIVTTLNTIGPELSFPPADPETKRPTFYMKTDGENSGMLPQLEAQGILKQIKRSEGQKGTLVEVLLKDPEIAHTCMKCAKDAAPILQTKPFELPRARRLRQCSQCRVVRYCGVECLKDDLSSHRIDCHIWRDRPHEAARLMENQRRAELGIYLAANGFQIVNATGSERRQDRGLLDWCLLASIPVLVAICFVCFGSALRA